nr:helix-turn-helix domain-containing protein [uncultured Allomuricauda sp.]
MEQIREQKLKTYHRHNNAESQESFDINMEKFNRQCRIVLEQLLTGRGMNCFDAMISLKIMDLRRRIKTLRDSGIPVADRPLGGGRKEYYITTEFLRNYRLV